MSPRNFAIVFASLLLAQAQEVVTTCHQSPEKCAESENGPDATTLLSLKAAPVRAELLSDGRSVEQTSADKRMVSQLQLDSVSLGKTLARHAQELPEGTTKSLLESFKICGECGTFKRFGEANDGGYLMCMDGVQGGSVTAAFSMGVEHHDQWSEDVLTTLGCPVGQFDCTVSTSACQGCKFFKKCITNPAHEHPVPGHESESWSLQEAVENTVDGPIAQIPDGSLLMKMDIESSEWPIYASETKEVLHKFGQIIVEFHGLELEDRHDEYLKAVQNILAAGFKVVHLHGNNYQGMYTTGTEAIPRVLEVTFAHASARSNGCSGDQLYTQFDSPNNPTAAELPMAHVE